MSKIAVNFFTEDVNYQLKHKTKVRAWLFEIITKEGYNLEELNFIFCSDEYLLKINQEFLDHDTYTDVITFDNSTIENSIAGDIFISIDRIQENAKAFKRPVFEELCRVIVHGTLHLLGYKDKTKAAKTLMTEKEDQALDILNNTLL
jgi:probable rRNA maturation factor